MTKIYFILLAAFAWTDGSAQIPPVPCPNYFRYVFDPYQNVEGIITIPYDGSSELQLTANASMKGFFGKENSNMQLSMVTAPSDLIQGLTPVINYKLQFPVQDSIPQITSLIFNYQQFCAGPPVPLSDSYYTADLYTSNTYPLSLPSQIRSKRTRITTGLLDRKDIPDHGNPYFYPLSYGFYDDSIYTGENVRSDDEATKNFYDYSHEDRRVFPANRAAN